MSGYDAIWRDFSDIERIRANMVRFEQIGSANAAEMLGHIVEKARNIKNPVEASFFLWVNLAYLQPFEDGNKRTSRLSANIPLMLYNCAPLSFLDIEMQDYALAMMSVYEHRNVALAADLFEWAYRRSIRNTLSRWKRWAFRTLCGYSFAKR